MFWQLPCNFTYSTSASSSASALAVVKSATTIAAFRPEYVFASHTFGRTDRELRPMGVALSRARDAFTAAFGRPPWLIGDEALFLEFRLLHQPVRQAP